MQPSPKPTAREALALRAEALKSLLLWHRRIGIVATLFVIISVVTGILLNHVSDLALDKVTVTSPWLLDHYGLAANAAPVGIDLGDRGVSWVEGTVYVADGTGEPLETLIGAAAGRGFVVVAGSDQILLLTPGGELVEAIDSHLLPGPILALGLTVGGNVAVRTNRGTFVSDTAFVGWTEARDTPIAWSTVQELPEAERETVLERFRGKGLPLDRVLLDIHSGHILGFWGALIMDVAAVLFLVLAITGMIVTLRRNGGPRSGNGRSS